MQKKKHTLTFVSISVDDELTLEPCDPIPQTKVQRMCSPTPCGTL